jgi:transposase
MDKKLSGFTESERNQAFERYNKIKPFLEDNTTIREISNNEKISYSTLCRWLKNYREKGLGGLVDKRRYDNGKGRIVKDELRLLVEGLALQKPKPSMASIHRKIVKIAETKNWRKPSYTTIRNIIKGIKPSVITLAHEGDKAYKDKYDLLYSRKANYPNEIWQADHSLLDIWLVDSKENIVRPWLTIIMDHYSRAIAGYFLFIREGRSDSGWIWCGSTDDGINWSEDKLIPSSSNAYGTSGAPSLITFNGKLYCIREGRSNSGCVWCGSTYDGINWSEDKLIPISGNAYGTSGAPSLIVFNGILYCIREGGDNSGWVWCASNDSANVDFANSPMESLSFLEK